MLEWKGSNHRGHQEAIGTQNTDRGCLAFRKVMSFGFEPVMDVQLT